MMDKDIPNIGRFLGYIGDDGKIHHKAILLTYNEAMNMSKTAKKLNNDGPTFVYLIGNENIVKMGKADNPEQRLKTIQTGNPYPLKILDTIECEHQEEGFRLERLLHKKCKEHRLKGEWFTNTEELQQEWNQLTTKDNP